MAPSELVWENSSGDRQVIGTPKITEAPVIDNENYTITWKNAFGEGIDFRYNISPDKFFKTVIVNKKENLPEPKIDQNGLRLTVVMGLSWDENVDPQNDFAKETKINGLDAKTETEKLIKSDKKDTAKKTEAEQTKTTVEATTIVSPAISGLVEENKVTQTVLPEQPKPELESVIKSEQLESASEELNVSDEFAFEDDQGRKVWWIGKPIAWDSSENKKTFELEQKFIRIEDKVYSDLALSGTKVFDEETRFPLYIDTNIPQEAVGASLDDVRRTYDNNLWSTNDWLVFGNSGAGYVRENSGMRFQTVPLAPGANIYNATLTLTGFTSAQGADANIKTKVRAQAEDNPGAFSTQADWDARFPGSLTTAVVNWDGFPAWSANTAYSSPNIATVVQELVNRAGWASNNSMVFFIDDYDNRSNSGSRRVAYSYDNNASYAPILNVGYYTPGTLNLYGTCKQLNRSTNCADAVTIKVAVNGVLQAQTGSTLTGAWSITGVSANAGDVITVFKDNVADANEAVSVMKLGTGDLSDVALYERHLTIGATLGGTVTNNDIGFYDNSVSADEDIFVEVDGSDNLTIPAAGTSDATVNQVIYPLNNNTWRPKQAGGTTTTVPTMVIPTGGTVTLDSNTVNMTALASVITNSGTLNTDTSTINFIATSGNVTVPSLTYYNLGVGTVQDATTARTYTLAGNTTVNNTITVGNALSTNADNFSVATYTLTMAGSGDSLWNVTAKGAISTTNSTINYIGSSATTVRGMSYYNLGIGTTADTGAGVTYTMGGASTIRNLATVGNASSTNSDTLNLSSYKMTITKASAYPFTVTAKGIFDAGTSEVEYYVDSTTNVSPLTYYNLTIDPVLTGDRTITTNGAITVNNNFTFMPYGASNPRTQTLTLAGTLTVNGTLRVEQSSTGRPVINTSTSNYAVSVGTLNIGIGGNIFANNSTVTVSGNATVAGVYAGMVNSNLSVAGNITVSGKMSTIGTVTLTKQNDASATITSGGSKFPNLVINASGSTYTLQDNLDVYGDLTITAGTLDASATGNRTIRLTGNWTNNGTFTARAGTVEYIDFESGKTITPNGQSFNNLSINSGAGGYTKSLFHFDGDNGSATFTDETGESWTAAGAAALSTTQKKFGATSIYCDGSTSWLTKSTNLSNYQIGNNDDFTIDAWIYLDEANTAAARMIAEEGNGSASWLTTTGHHWVFFKHTDAKLYFQWNNAGAAGQVVSSTTIPATTWTHVAAVRTGGFIKLYINGVERGTVASPAFISLPSGGTPSVNICSTADHTASQVWKGYIDEFRFQKGVGRWGAAFTSPSAAYSSSQTISGATNVLGNFTQVGSTVTAPAAGSAFSIGGNYSVASNSIFNHNSGTVTLNGSGAQSFTAGAADANHDLYNLTVTNASASGVSFADSLTLGGTFTDTTASSKLTFNAGSTYTFPNININGGSTGTRVTLTGSGEWNMIVSQADPVANNVHVTNSNATGSSAPINASVGGYDNGGNTYWDFGAAPVSINISGTAYGSEDKTSNIGPNKTIALSVAGGAPVYAETTDGGAFNFNNVSVANNNTVLIYISGETEKGSYLTQVPDSITELTNLELFSSHIVLSHDTAGPLTNNLISNAEIADTDTLFTVDESKNVTFSVLPNIETHILSGKTYTPGAESYFGSLHIPTSATFTPQNNLFALNDSGTPLVVGGTFNEGGSTVLYQGTSATNITGTTYFNLKLNQADTTFTSAGSTEVKGVFTNEAGTFDGSSQHVYLTGTGGTPFVNTGSFSPSTSTFHYSGDNSGGNTNITATTYNNLYLDSASETFVPAGNITASGVFTINAGTFSASDKTITLSGSGTPLVINGTFSEGTSTIEYSGSSATNVTGSTYKNLKVNHTGTTFTAAGSTTVSGVFTIQAGTFDGSDKTIILSGAGTPFVKTGTFTPSSSTIRYTGEGDTTITAANYWNLETKPPSGAASGGWTLSGAGNSAYNGNYTQSGTYNGQPSYTNGSMWLYYCQVGMPEPGNAWGLSSATGGCFDPYFDTAYYQYPGAALPGSWYVGMNGTAPAPSFAELAGGYTYTLASGTFNIGGNYTNGDGSHGVVTNATTNDPAISVDGNFSNSASATFIASNSADFGIASNYTNAGTFTDSGGALTLDGQGLQTITAGGTSANFDFTNLVITNASEAGVSFADSLTVTGTFTAVTPSSKVTFHSGSTYAFNAININGQATGTRITLTSSSAGSPWNLNITAASPTASNVRVKDSNANKDIDATTGGYDDTGNTHWLFPVVLNVSGTVYTAENKTTNIGSGKTVALSIQGGEAVTVDTTSGGAFSFEGVSFGTNNTIAVYISGETEKGSLITQAANGTSSITGLELFTGHIVLTHNTAGPMTNALLATADNVADSDLLVSVDGSSVATFATDNQVWILNDKTYTPGGAISLHDANIDGNLTLGANTATISGSWDSTSGNFSSSGTVTFNNSSGTETLITGGLGGSGGYTVSGTLSDNSYTGAYTESGTMNGQPKYTNGSKWLYYNQHGFPEPGYEWALAASASDCMDTFMCTAYYQYPGNTDPTTGTWYASMDYSGTPTLAAAPSGGGTFTNLTKTGNGILQISTDEIDIDGTLSIGSGATFDLNGQDLSLATLSNDGTFKLQGGESAVTVTNMDINSGLVEYVGTGTYSALKLGNSYYDLKINGSGGSFSPNGTVTVANDLDISAGTLAGTQSINVNGGDTTGNGTINLIGGTFTLDGTGNFAGNTNWTFYNLTFGDGSGTATSTKTGSNQITATNVMTIAANQTLDAGDDTWVLSGTGTPFVKTGTFTAGTSTIKYTGGGNTTITAADYNNLESSPASAAGGGDGWVVSGAGTSAVNGTYTASGTCNAKTSYRLGSTSYYLYWCGGASRWVIDAQSCGCPPPNNAVYNGASSTELPATPWTVGLSGSLPVPDVAQSSSTPTYTLASGTINVGGNYVNGDASHAVITTADANDPVFNVDGNFTNSAGATFVSSASADFSIASNYTNSPTGILTANGGLTLDGQGLQTITAGGVDTDHDFNNLTITNASVAGVEFADSSTVAGTFTDTTASSKVTFHSGSTYAFNAISINGGSTDTRITLTSSSSGSAWNFNITESTPSASYVWVKDSNANKDIDATTGGYDGTGNTHWIFPGGLMLIQLTIP